MRLRGRIAGIAALAAIVLAVPTAANATFVYWKSQSSPLTLVKDGRTLGQAYGSVQIYQCDQPLCIHYSGRGYLRDRSANGNPVYWKNHIWGPVSTTGNFIESSAKWGGTSWHLETRYRKAANLATRWTSFEANIFVCEQRAWAIDPCKNYWLPNRYPITNS